MKKIMNYIFLALKGVIFIYFPVILLLSLFYYFVLERGFVLSLNLIFFYPLLIGISTANSYKGRKFEIKIEDFSQMEKYIEEGKWEILIKNKNGMTLKPKFDFPFKNVIEDRVWVNYQDQQVSIEGPGYYIENLSKDIKGKPNFLFRHFTSMAGVFLIIILVALTIFQDLGIRWEREKVKHHEFVENVKVIDFSQSDIVGNSIINLNNYGMAVENEEYIFCINDILNLIRVDKNFQNEKILIQKSGGNGLSSLNIVGDWVYYTSGQELNRISMDGSKTETIYKSSYLLDIHIKDKWIYFINFPNESNVYRMDLNGRNLEKFLEIHDPDISIYDDRMIFSYSQDEKSFVESIKLDGSDRRLEFEDTAYNLIKLDDYYYYLDEDYGLYRRSLDENLESQVLLEGQVSSYTVVNDKIFYSLFSQDVGYPGTSLYQAELDGTDQTLILDEEGIEGFALVGDWLLFHSFGNDYITKLNKMNIKTGEIEIISLDL